MRRQELKWTARRDCKRAFTFRQARATNDSIRHLPRQSMILQVLILHLSKSSMLSAL